MATVIGPTPPGTGDSAPATRLTEGACTSPTKRTPAAVSAGLMRGFGGDGEEEEEEDEEEEEEGDSDEDEEEEEEGDSDEGAATGSLATKLMPTSTTAAPGLIQSCCTY